MCASVIDGHSTAALAAKWACAHEVSNARFYILVAGSPQESEEICVQARTQV